MARIKTQIVDFVLVSVLCHRDLPNISWEVQTSASLPLVAFVFFFMNIWNRFKGRLQVRGVWGENAAQQSDKDAHLVWEPALTRLQLSGEGTVLRSWLTVGLFLLSLQRKRTPEFGFNRRPVSTSTAGFHTRLASSQIFIFICTLYFMTCDSAAYLSDSTNKQAEMFPAALVLMLLAPLAPDCCEWKLRPFPWGPHCSYQVLPNRPPLKENLRAGSLSLQR